MKLDWELKEFEDCLEKVIYTNKIQRKDFFEVGNYPIISQEQDFINGYWNNTDDLFRVKKPIVIFGDHTQVLKYVDFDFVLGADGVKILQTKNSIDPRFFYYFLQNVNLGSLGYARHYRLLKEIEVSYPKSLPEQQRIVAILDDAFAKIEKAKANAEQNLKNAKELFESYLQGVFENKGEGWEMKTLGEVCEFTQGIQRDVKLQSENQKDNQVRFLRIVDFTQGNEPPRYIDNPGDKYILNSNDISLVRYGASTGFVCRGLQGALANNLFRVIPKSKKEITNDFLFVYLTAPVFQNVIKESMNGAAMPAISFGLIKDIQKLDALSAETKKLEAIYEQKIKDLEELKKSLLQKAFSGEL
jgi:type I restriction enzyme S subunit